MHGKDLPRSLKSPDEILRRRAMLLQEHVRPLQEFVQSLRTRGLGDVPEFDPLDGGVNARALFLYEKPGPKAFLSGFISRNNDDPTAETTFNFMQQAQIDRKKTCLWNVIPGWNGMVNISTEELRSGTLCLDELLALLPKLKAIVAVGKRAEKALANVELHQVKLLTSVHPSPKNRALIPDRWREIPAQWAKVLDYIN